MVCTMALALIMTLLSATCAANDLQSSGVAALKSDGTTNLPGHPYTLLQNSTADEQVLKIFAEPAAAGRLLFTSGLLWDAAKLDAAAAGETPDAYLARVRQATASFFRARDADGLPLLVGHEATLAALRILGEDDGDGQLWLLTGPSSVGKSLLLQKAAVELKKRNRRVVIADARQYEADVVKGIVSSLSADRSFLQVVLEAAPAPVAANLSALVAVLASPVADTTVDDGGASVIDGATRYSESVFSATVPIDQLIAAFIAACNKRGEYPVIFIDEADQALSNADPAAKQRTLALLQLFTRITKQTREASVVLSTSEHGLPSRLQGLGFNTGHIADIIVAGEVPPAEMKDLLTKTWGCGEHLATALLSMYGGHVLYASAAVRKLATAADRAAMEGSNVIVSLLHHPAACFSYDTFNAAGVAHEDRYAMSWRVDAALRALVVDGFVLLGTPKDQVAKIISLANAGFVVPRGATASPLPAKAWTARLPGGKAPSYILVPSSHTMRLLIASEVFPLEKLKGKA